MNDQDLLALLTSGQYDTISRALMYINKLNDRPSEKLAAKLVELCSHNDPEIRQEAVRAAGFYWHLPAVFPVLTEIVGCPDEDDLVLNAAVYAMREMAHNMPELRDRTLTLLARVALNESMPPMVRKNAYALALNFKGIISIDAFAKLAVSSDVVIDKEVMYSLQSHS